MGKSDSRSSVSDRGARRAAKADLVYINEFDAGISRRRRGKGFSYAHDSGRAVNSKSVLRRIKAMAIPPAWEEVWICRDSKGHVQARGRDEAGRQQSIYHERWSAISAATKFDRMHGFGQLLPRIRRRVRKDLNRTSIDKPRVLAAVVRLIDKAHLRVGNEQNIEVTGARGATTLAPKHVETDGLHLSLDFPGKSGKRREVELADRKVARVIDRCSDLNGQFLFSYKGNGDQVFRLDSTSVNEYLREISKQDITAKDFRTWWGSVIACESLAADYDDSTKQQRIRSVGRAIAAAAEALGNTKAVCKSSYVHPGLQAAGRSGEFPILVERAQSNGRASKPISELTQAEILFAGILPLFDM